MKFIKKIRFESRHLEVHFSIFSIALMTYINAGLLVTYGYSQISYLPHAFTPNWIIFYGKMIKTSMILSQLMPYAGKLKILCKRGCCCCVRKRYRPDTMNNPTFPKERRYASLIAMVFISFTYGAILPLILWLSALILIAQYVMDKLLISYFYKQEVQYNDLLNLNVVRAIKYALVPFFLLAGIALHNNYCAISKQVETLEFTNQQLYCQKMWYQPEFMIICAVATFCFLLLVDLTMLWLELRRRKELTEGDEREFFRRLSELDRKRLIAEEHYRFFNYGIKTFDDAAYERLTQTPGRFASLALDPPCYELLTNEFERSKLLYTPLYLDESEEQKGISDQVTRALYSYYLPPKRCAFSDQKDTAYSTGI